MSDKSQLSDQVESSTQRDSITMADRQVTNLQILDIHELAAGKLTALLERQTGRDFFDANELFQYTNIDKSKLRIIFILYSAMCSKKDMLSLTSDGITVDHRDLKNKLIPVMKNNFCDGFSSVKEWTTVIISNVRKEFETLLPYTPSEAEFIRAVINGVGVKPELFIDDESLVDFSLIKKHPALLWAKKRTRK